jgi:hypothetical protein
MGHTDPALALAIYAHAMRREEGENGRLLDLIQRGQQLIATSPQGSHVAEELVR